MNDVHNFTLALFYCRNIPGSSELERLDLERKYGDRIRFYPLPCSGRLEPVHMLRALEGFADAAYLIACPEGACRNFEGNYRARKRVERTKEIIKSIGLEPERVEIIVGSGERPEPLADQAGKILESCSKLGISPVFQKQ